MDDVKKTIAATPFISTSLPEEIRKKMGEGILSFQRDIRRAGISEQFGSFAQQFLSGQTGALDLINSGKPLESFLGTQIAQRAGTVGEIYDPKQRTDILKSIIEDPALQTQLRELALETSGYKIFLEDLNTALFNPRAGIFGSLREVTMGIGDKTNIFRETNSLVESIFGRQGLFVNFFRQVGKIFGLEDPLKVIISGVRFLTKQFNELNKFVQSPAFQGIVNAIKEVFGRIKSFTEKLYAQVTEDWENPESIIGKVRSIGEGVSGFFSSIYDTIRGGTLEPRSITESIKDIGSSVREFVKTLGETIRGEDVSDEARFGSSILGTLISEIGKTAVTVFSELGKTIVNKVPEIAAQVIPALGTAIVDAIKGSFEQGPLEGAIAAALAGGAGIFALRKLGGALGAGRGGVNAFLESSRNQQTGGRAGQLNRFFGSPFGPLLGRGGANAVTETSETTFRAQMLALVQRIANCVCRPGFGGGGGLDLDADARSRDDAGRRRTSALGYAGPRRGGSSVPPLGQAGFPVEGPLDAYTGRRRNRPGLASRAGQFLFDTGDDLAFPGSVDRSRQNVAARFNRRYGTGGTRAAYGRSISRGIRGFGRGALIAGGIGLLGSAILGGGSAQAAETGGETPAMGAGQALGNIGMGAAEGALTGAMFGPWGAAIGGVLGAGISLMDRGTREAAGKWVSNLMGSIGRFSTELINGTGKFISGITTNLGKSAQSLIKFFVTDLPGIWLGGMKTLYVDIPKKLIEFGQALGRNMLESVSKFDLGEALRSTWESIKNFATGQSTQPRAVGGNVYAGGMYKVGERGPELFAPTTNGTITNNATLNNLMRNAGQSTSASNTTFNITINASGVTGQDIANSIREPVLQIIEQAWQQASTGTSSRGSTLV